MSVPAGPDRSGVRIFPPAIFLIALIAGFLLEYVWPVRILPERFAPLLLWTGGLLLLTWLGLAVWAVLTFRAAGTTPHPNRPTTALAFGGPFRYTRNPMYVSLVLMCLGVSLLANAAWPLLMVLPAVVTVRRAVIDPEERYLSRKFGAEYDAYRKRVRRWI